MKGRWGGGDDQCPTELRSRGKRLLIEVDVDEFIRPCMTVVASLEIHTDLSVGEEFAAIREMRRRSRALLVAERPGWSKVPTLPVPRFYYSIAREAAADHGFKLADIQARGGSLLEWIARRHVAQRLREAGGSWREIGRVMCRNHGTVQQIGRRKQPGRKR